MNRRRDLLRAIAGAAAFGAAIGRASAQERLRRIGYLGLGSPKSAAQVLEAFRAGLKERGWIEGRNFTLELRQADGRIERVPGLAKELVDLKPDIIVTAANRLIVELKKITSTIPIVMAGGADPVEWGLVASFARPGGNLTGVTSFYEATPIKMLELVAGLVPRGSRVGALLESGTPLARPHPRGELERTAKTLELRLEVTEASTADQLTDAIKDLGGKKFAALILLPGATLYVLRETLVRITQSFRIPVVYPFEEMVELGGLMSYSVNLAEGFRRAAYFVDRILRGANPGELPIEQPTLLALAINLKTAKAQGIRIPQEMLFRANRVIE